MLSIDAGAKCEHCYNHFSSNKLTTVTHPPRGCFISPSRWVLCKSCLEKNKKEFESLYETAVMENFMDTIINIHSGITYR